MRKAIVPEETDTSRVTFRVGDACKLPQNLAPWLEAWTKRSMWLGGYDKNL